MVTVVSVRVRFSAWAHSSAGTSVRFQCWAQRCVGTVTRWHNDTLSHRFFNARFNAMWAQRHMGTTERGFNGTWTHRPVPIVGQSGGRFVPCAPTMDDSPRVKILCRLCTPKTSFGWDYEPNAIASGFLRHQKWWLLGFTYSRLWAVYLFSVCGETLCMTVRIKVNCVSTTSLPMTVLKSRASS